VTGFEPATTHEIMELVNKTIETMPDLTQQIFINRWKNGCFVKETAEQLKISESSVNERYNWAMSLVHKKVVTLYPPNSFALLVGLYLLEKMK